MPTEPVRYSVSSNQRTLDRLLSLNEIAETIDVLPDWAATLRSIFERLETQPEASGDPLYRLKRLNLTVFRLLLNRIRVLYAVHDWERVVFVQEVDPVLGHPLQEFD